MHTHPGVALGALISTLDLSQRELAQQIGVHKTIINEVINGKRSINAKLAVKLDIAALGSAETWLSKQAQYDIQQERARLKLATAPA